MPDVPSGIVSYAGYVPRHRLSLEAIGAGLGSGGGPGARSVASHDEDATTMGVEAGRRAIRDEAPRSVFFATTSPPYTDKTNACALHVALGLPRNGLAVDLAGSVRGSVGALRVAAAADAAAVLSDVRTGLPGSADERDGGDGAAAFVFGQGEKVIAEVLAEASVTVEFLDRWREPGKTSSHVWEERFGGAQYAQLIGEVVERVLKAAGVDRVERAVLSSPHSRTALSEATKLPADSVHSARAQIGYSGAADIGLALADALDAAGPGETILVISAADGADALLLRTTAALADHRAASGLNVLDGSTNPIDYNAYLTWRGYLEREPPRRPTPSRTAAPPSARSHDWKFAFVGSRCNRCSRLHLPPQRVCASCHAIDDMTAAPLSGKQATVATFTVDRLAFSLAPPLVNAVVDFDDGGRFICQLTDIAAEKVAIGDRVEMTFRRLGSVEGIKNYFWKARPIAHVAALVEAAA